MKRWLMIGGAAVVLAAIIIASVRSSGPKGEKVYTEKAAAKTIESVVTAESGRSGSDLKMLARPARMSLNPSWS